MSNIKISDEIKAKAEETEKIDKEAIEQKSKQLEEQAQALTDQASAQAEKLAADAQAKIAEANRKLAELPKEIDKTIEEAKKTLDSFLGKTLPPTGDPANIDFDPNSIMGPIKAALNPVMSGIGPVEAVVGKVPVLGDLIGLLTGMVAQSGPSTLSKEEIKALVPKPPEVPDSVMQSINGLVNDVISFCQQLPTLLIDILFQMMAVIPGLFNMIAGVIGVPSIPFPLNLVTEMPALMPKIKKLITELPTQVLQLVEGIVRQKYAESMALAVPKPQISNIPRTLPATPATIGKEVPKPSMPPPVQSPIAPTPSITPPEPKEPKVSKTKESPKIIKFRLKENVIEIWKNGLKNECIQAIISNSALKAINKSESTTIIEINKDATVDEIENEVLNILKPICETKDVEINILVRSLIDKNTINYGLEKKSFFGFF